MKLVHLFLILNSDQVFLSILRNPLAWYSEPIIYLKRGNDSIRNVIGIDSNRKHASFIDFFDGQGNYKISQYLEQAYKSSLPNQFEKDFIETDRKVNLLFSALEGEILKIFPVPNDLLTFLKSSDVKVFSGFILPPES